MAHDAPHVTRRSMLQSSGGTFAAFGVAAVSGHWPKLLLSRLRLQDVTAKSFLPFLGETFVFQGPAEDCGETSSGQELKLTKVSPHESITRIGSRNSANYGKRRRESFSLLFEQKAGKPLNSGLHRLMHADFEDFQVFLSPVGVPGRNGTIRLEAIFG